MNNFTEHLRQARRLVILRLLSEQNAYTTNSSVLHRALHHLGIASSRDDVATDLAWLAEHGLLTLEQPVPALYVATLTARGHDVVLGNAIVPGVSRPSPR